MWNTIYYTAVSVPLGMVLSLGLAMALNRSIPGVGFYRTLVLIPVISSTVATALLWGLMLDPYIGLANHLLRLARAARLRLADRHQRWPCRPSS